jgi:hypothetical protein
MPETPYCVRQRSAPLAHQCLLQKQDAFAAVPSRRAVFSEGRGPRAAVRALGSETALQPTSNHNARLSKADASTQLLVTMVGSILVLFCCMHPARLAHPLALSRSFWSVGRDCGRDRLS